MDAILVSAQWQLTLVYSDDIVVISKSPVDDIERSAHIAATLRSRTYAQAE